jgi:hypothetical protein
MFLVARAFKEVFNDVQEAVDYEIKAFSEIPSDHASGFRPQSVFCSTLSAMDPIQ